MVSPAATYGTHGNDDVILDGAAVTSENSAWAIGHTQAMSALAHWNGSTWTSAYAPFPLPAVSYQSRRGRSAFISRPAYLRRTVLRIGATRRRRQIPDAPAKSATMRPGGGPVPVSDLNSI